MTEFIKLTPSRRNYDTTYQCEQWDCGQRHRWNELCPMVRYYRYHRMKEANACYWASTNEAYGKNIPRNNIEYRWRRKWAKKIEAFGGNHKKFI